MRVGRGAHYNARIHPLIRLVQLPMVVEHRPENTCLPITITKSHMSTAWRNASPTALARRIVALPPVVGTAMPAPQRSSRGGWKRLPCPRAQSCIQSPWRTREVRPPSCMRCERSRLAPQWVILKRRLATTEQDFAETRKINRMPKAHHSMSCRSPRPGCTETPPSWNEPVHPATTRSGPTCNPCLLINSCRRLSSATRAQCVPSLF